MWKGVDWRRLEVRNPQNQPERAGTETVGVSFRSWQSASPVSVVRRFTLQVYGTNMTTTSVRGPGDSPKPLDYSTRATVVAVVPYLYPCSPRLVPSLVVRVP